MRNFLLGLATGVSIAVGAHAWAAGVFGDGYLAGWDVVMGGDTVCSDPYVWLGSHEIECDEQ
jgi:hypothetical protein